MVTGEEYIDELIEQYPQINNFFLQYNVSLLVCGEPVWGTLKEFLKSKNLENIEDIIKKLNKFLETASEKSTIKKADENLKIDF